MARYMVTFERTTVETCHVVVDATSLRQARAASDDAQEWAEAHGDWGIDTEEIERESVEEVDSDEPPDVVAGHAR